MVDVYGLRNLRDEFPGAQSLKSDVDAYQKVAHLENALKEDIKDAYCLTSRCTNSKH